MPRPWRDADRRRRAYVEDLRLERALAVEDLDSLVPAVGDVDIPLRIDRDPMHDVELIVDSGEHFAVVPREILKELGIRPRRKRSFVLANGEKFERKMCNAEFEYKGEPGAAPVVFGEKGDFPLLGVTTLEALGLLFDPLHQGLKPLPLMML